MFTLILSISTTQIVKVSYEKRGSKVFLCFLNTGRNAFLIGYREKEGFLMHFCSELTQLPLVSASSLVSQNFSEAVEIAYVRT